MVFVSNGTPEGDKRARRLNLKSSALRDQIAAEVRDFHSAMTPEERADVQAIRIALARLGKNRMFKMRLAALRQRLDRTIVNAPGNADVMLPRRGPALTLEQMATILADTEWAALKPLDAE